MTQNSFLSQKKDANDPEKLYRLRTEWQTKSCEITIFNEEITYAYCGQITEDQVKTMSKALKYTEKEYIEECKNSLHPDQDDRLYSYEMDGDSFIVKKKLSETKSIKRLLFNVKLEKVDFRKSFFQMFDDALKQFTETYAMFKETKMEIESIRRNYEDVIERMKEMVKLKTENEEVSYTQFSSVLNTKKVKITQQQNQIRRLEKRLPAGDGELEESAEMDFTPDDDSAYDVDTDDMEDMCDEPSPVVAVCYEPSSTNVVYGDVSPKQLCVSQSGISEEPKTNPEPICSEKEKVTDKKPSESLQRYEPIFGEASRGATNVENSTVLSETQDDSSNTYERSAVETDSTESLFDLTVRFG